VAAQISRRRPFVPHTSSDLQPPLRAGPFSSVVMPEIGSGGLAPTTAATKPFAKLAVKATTIADIPHLVFQALAAAMSGRPGRCYLDIPSDVLHQTLPEGPNPRPRLS
jgi:thiamine pyrophosphate-dependent acetolactate synthase large subunit-like protein